jgi:hypothetical protein
MSAIKEIEKTESQELAEMERREGEIASGQVQPLTEAEFWKRVNTLRANGPQCDSLG